MHKLFWLFLVCQILAGCSMEKYCNQRYPPLTKDSVWTKTDTLTLHDTLYIGGESLTIDTSFGFIPDSAFFHVEEKKGHIRSVVDIRKGRLKVECIADSLMRLISYQNKVISNFHQKKEVKYLPCEKKHVTRWYEFTFWFTWISLILIFIAFILWILKKYLGR